MKVIFRCEIDSTIPDDDKFRPFRFTKILESENPEELLHALAFTNGTENGVPTVEKLLVHLFVTGAAYTGRNYSIIIR